MRTIARNSASSINHTAEVEKNANTRNKAACTGLRTVTTMPAAIISNAAKK
jgi:hypothetical protein